MYRLDAHKPVHFCDGLTRRDFLHAGSLSALGLALPGLRALEARGAVDRSRDMNCILLFLVGGPSQLDTWDMKPDAPAEIRGPFKAIKTSVPEIQVSEIFPGHAKLADKFSLVRTCYHTAAAVHDTGHQMMQTGYLFRGGQEYPHYGSVVSHLRGRSPGGLPPFVVLPGPIGNTGVRRRTRTPSGLRVICAMTGGRLGAGRRRSHPPVPPIRNSSAPTS